MTPNPESESMKIAVMWYGVGMLPMLRKASREQLICIMKEADKHNMAEPLWMCPKPQFMVPCWSEQPLTGCQVIALMVFGLWVSCEESEELASGLMNYWGDYIKTAVTLCGEIECHVKSMDLSEQSAAAGVVR